MGHWKCVVIIPPESAQDNTPQIIAELMAPFGDVWWDEYEIGGWWDEYEIGGCFTAGGEPAVRRLADIPSHEIAERVVVADPAADEYQYMAQRKFWNGVNFVRSAWDGRIMSAVDAANAEGRAFRSGRPVDADWLAVTVDYHS